MVCHYELEYANLSVTDNLCIREDLHSFPYFRGAGSKEFFLSCDLNGAETAACLYTLIRVVAEMWNVNTDELRSFYYFCTLGSFYRDIVYFKMDHFH